MNFVSADVVCCAYPNLTLYHCGVFVSKRVMHASMPEGTRILPMEKYQDRGYTFYSEAFDWDDNQCPPWCCRAQERVFGDQGCILVEFAELSQPRSHVQHPVSAPFGWSDTWSLSETSCFCCNCENNGSNACVEVVTSAVYHGVELFHR